MAKEPNSPFRFLLSEPIFRKVLTTAALDSGINYTLISGPSLDPSKFKEIPKNVQILRFVGDTFPYIRSSDAVIAPGGHSTMMEALSFGTPILSFPDEGHSEQENNAAVIEEEGYGRMLSYSTPPEVILECIREVLEDKKYRDKVKRLPGNANISFDGIDAGQLLLNLDAYGICASAGSACSTGNPEPSHVLVAIGLDRNLSEGTLRTTFGKDNTKQDVEFLVDSLVNIIQKKY